MQYTVLVVDDEEEIREGIIRKIDWESYGFRIIGSAGNGSDALEIAENLQPDVVMTDVMMPFMDGLELGERIIRMNPEAKLLVFSGADEFEYAAGTQPPAEELVKELKKPAIFLLISLHSLHEL